MFCLNSELLTFSFLETGDLFESKILDKQISLMKGNYIDGSYNNIFLRLKMNGEYHHTPLLGKNSPGICSKSADACCWKGDFHGIAYEVVLTLVNHIFYYKVSLIGSGECELFFCNDLCLGYPINESYNGQYIDHKVIYENSSYTILSRQNQKQKGKNPFIQLGSLQKIKGFSTDAFQFFGKEYKVTNQIKALSEDLLENKVYQYEFPYIALQTETILLDGENNTTFYGMVKEDLEGASKELLDLDLIREYANYPVERDFTEVKPVNYALGVHKVLSGMPYSMEEVRNLYDEMECAEYQDGELLSFFSGEKHIVLAEKERLVERQHGHILISTKETIIDENIISSTSYMCGVFNSHVVVGNTSYNIFMSHIRDNLNLYKLNGQRVFVRIDGNFVLLTEPSLFEIGLNYCRWHYKIEDDIIIVENFTKLNEPVIRFTIKSMTGKRYDYLITNLLNMGEDEYGKLGEITESHNEMLFNLDSKSYAYSRYPELNYKIILDGGCMTSSGDEIFYEDGKSRIPNLKCFKSEDTAEFSMTIEGRTDQRIRDRQSEILFSESYLEYKEYFAGLINDFKLYDPKKASLDLERFNIIAYWYAHNAMVHYTMPHGLEQYGGAAWGTRDVCQGPFEFFLANQNYKECRQIILKVYAHQMKEDGNWSQWFMFDKFQELQMHESHGDVIVWPLKALTSYLKYTGDYCILEEEIPYVLREHQFSDTKENYTLLEHVRLQIAYIQDNFYEGTSLSKYGGGDWDDTLQPADKELKEKMVSAWTVSLTYEVLGDLSLVLDRVDTELKVEIDHIRDTIQKEYNTHIIKDGVVSGFINFEGNKINHIIHPSDQKTEISYRLLPMTRSMISKLFSKKQAFEHFEIIKKHLYFSDGVRLMSRPAKYLGGVNSFFMRAELAANFGREIGLNYIHADIRFAEAMAALGESDETMKFLLKINPVKIQNTVYNAALRQSNTYFSSSDGDFYNRYEAETNYYKLRSGETKVKAGWRIYSSGPGIFMGQLICNVLGIRFDHENLMIDPVIGKEYDNMHFDFKLYGKKVTFVFQVEGNHSTAFRVLLDGKAIEGVRLENPYRKAGLMISKDIILTHMKDGSKIIIEMKE